MYVTWNHGPALSPCRPRGIRSVPLQLALGCRGARCTPARSRASYVSVGPRSSKWALPLLGARCVPARRCRTAVSTEGMVGSAGCLVRPSGCARGCWNAERVGVVLLAMHTRPVKPLLTVRARWVNAGVRSCWCSFACGHRARCWEKQLDA